MVCQRSLPESRANGLSSPRDAWAKHRDLDQYEAKCLYVDALLKVFGTSHFRSRRILHDL